MAKIRLTKNELKKQKDDLERCRRYLPMLELKKKQLVQEIGRVEEGIAKLKGQIEALEAEVLQWVGVFAEELDWDRIFKTKEIEVGLENIAGIEIPIYKGVRFDVFAYDLVETPLWVDMGAEVCKRQIERWAEVGVIEKQRQILQEELRITIQRIKLFEEVKIPEAQRHIRAIRIFMGDQQTAEMVRGKIAKAKIDKKKREALPL